MSCPKCAELELRLSEAETRIKELEEALAIFDPGFNSINREAQK